MKPRLRNAHCRKRARLRLCGILSAAIATTATHAQQSASGLDAQRRQDEQRQQTEQRAAERPSVLAPSTEPPAINLASLPLDTPCFPIRALDLDGYSFAWLDRLLRPVIGQSPKGTSSGACVGKSAIQAIQDAANNALIERGYVTSRVLVPQQDLAGGTLRLTVIAGRVAAVQRDEPSGPEIGWSRAVLPTYPGAIYNQRDIDQALESVRRLAGQADTAFDVAPSDAPDARPGDSVLIVKPSTGKRWHATVGADNYGLDSTGRYNLNGSFTFDSPLHLYDQLTLSGSTNANFHSDDKASRSAALNWNVPVGYASLFVNASRSRYVQSVAGFDEPLRYSGDSAELNAGVNYVPYRSASARTSTQFKLYHRYGHSYIDGQPLDVQNRDLIGFEASASHQQYLGSAVLSGGATWRQTLLGVTHNPGTILGDTGWNGHTRIATANLQAAVPFAIGGQTFRYAGQFNWQHAYTRIVPFDYLTIGSPYTVRGFDGQTTLAAESGWTWRNELAVQVAGQTPFVALDAGRVSGPSAAALLGTTLIGTALGLRGHLPASRYAAIDYEITLGWPLVKPRGFPTAHPALMFQASTLF
jgi:hemolysin activation/secretion protein